MQWERDGEFQKRRGRREIRRAERAEQRREWGRERGETRWWRGRIEGRDKKRE